MADEEFRAAYAAFLRSWVGVEFFDHGQGEKDFEDAVDQLVSQGGPVTQMLRSFHAEHGRYPDFEEICPPGGPVVVKPFRPQMAIAGALRRRRRELGVGERTESRNGA